MNGNTASFAGITNSFSYNKRLQPVNMSASFGSATHTVFDINYDPNEIAERVEPATPPRPVVKELSQNKSLENIVDSILLSQNQFGERRG